MSKAPSATQVARAPSRGAAQVPSAYASAPPRPTFAPRAAPQVSASAHDEVGEEYGEPLQLGAPPASVDGPIY